MARPTLFISYSHKNEDEKEQLLKYLKALRIDLDYFWYDDKIETGEEWEKAINKAIEEASIAVLLVTVEFLSSEFIMNVEFPKIIDEHKKRRSLRIFPIIAKHCPWKKNKILAKLNVKPKNGNPIWDQGRDVDEELTKIVEEIDDIVKSQKRVNYQRYKQKRKIVQIGVIAMTKKEAKELYSVVDPHKEGLLLRELDSAIRRKGMEDFTIFYDDESRNNWKPWIIDNNLNLKDQDSQLNDKKTLKKRKEYYKTEDKPIISIKAILDNEINRLNLISQKILIIPEYLSDDFLSHKREDRQLAWGNFEKEGGILIIDSISMCHPRIRELYYKANVINQSYDIKLIVMSPVFLDALNFKQIIENIIYNDIMERAFSFYSKNFDSFYEFNVVDSCDFRRWLFSVLYKSKRHRNTLIDTKRDKIRALSGLKGKGGVKNKIFGDSSE